MTKKPAQTPMMQQYHGIKAKYPDAFLFYRLGDFYEMFFDDAVQGAKILELTLTSRNRNAEDPVPMCGVPYHSARGYIDTLVEKGYKVAICEQVEDPKTAKGMVKREVVQLVTPGTAVDSTKLDAKTNNYLSAVMKTNGRFQLAYADLSTGELRVTSFDDHEELFNELSSLHTREVVVEEGTELGIEAELEERLSILVSESAKQPLPADYTFVVEEVEDAKLLGVLELLITYLYETQLRSLDHLKKAETYDSTQFLRMGQSAKRNLELQVSLRDRSKKGTLVWLLDETKTAMGGRKLKQWIDKPLLSKSAIEARLDLVDSLLTHYFERSDLTTMLEDVYDLERLAGKVAFGNVNGRDLIQLKTSLKQIPHLKRLIATMDQGEWTPLLDRLDPVPEALALIERAVHDDPPLSVTEGNIIKDGYDTQLDMYRDAMHHGKQWIASLEQAEREKSGIRTLKIGFNKVFGYYIEITKSHLDKVDTERYERKQTLANAERFITPELKEKERLILDAEDKSIALEQALFQKLRLEIKAYITPLQRLAETVAEIDVLQSFAVVSDKHRYNRPSFQTDSQSVDIRGGRHPVVERVMGSNTYVPNDVLMGEKQDILLITGPNMSGKSTYMRQVALTVVMAQMGCFVPAETAHLPLFDQIFTRIGAMDDLISGQSTFMVEMMEANEALQHATDKSLILFDELGRGTATYDGMALAEAIIEHTHEHVRAKILFSTHYHELTALEERLARLENVHVGAVEEKGELVFLHKVLPGPADRSFGIQAAKRAGIPDAILTRATVILEALEQQNPIPFKKESVSLSVDQGKSDTPVTQQDASVKNTELQDTELQHTELQDKVEESIQTELLPEDPTPVPKKKTSHVEDQLVKELKRLSIANMTPMEALQTLYAMQETLFKTH